jgi:hypothetical protein
MYFHASLLVEMGSCSVVICYISSRNIIKCMKAVSVGNSIANRIRYEKVTACCTPAWAKIPVPKAECSAGSCRRWGLRQKKKTHIHTCMHCDLSLE